MRRKNLLILAISVSALGACAPGAGSITSADRPAPARPAPARPASARPASAQQVWAFQSSDLPVDPAFRFGQLANGMRYVVRANANPKGTALVRMELATGSLDEQDDERGFAHFVEHMAFNGSRNVPEGEMVRLLERKGLAFGADTNASTSFQQTTYMLDLPRNDADMLDTALMLMRETASELTFTPEAVARERGVILAERRDRNTWQYRNVEDQSAFAHVGARYVARFPIGTPATLQGATADSLKAFWRRTYAPHRTTVIVIGDVDPAAAEAAIRARFENWQASAPLPQPGAGPVSAKDTGRTDIYLDPAMSERVAISRNGPRLDEPDTLAQRKEDVLRLIGYGIVNRRLIQIARQPDPPFRGAGFGTGDVFKAGRSTNLLVDTVDRGWKRGLVAASTEYRRALTQGFTASEVAEQVANLRTQARNEVALGETRAHGALLRAVFALIRDDMVPMAPAAALERLEAFIPEITPQRVLAALKREALPLEDPLIRFQGRTAPEGGEQALRAAWNEAVRAPVTDRQAEEIAPFAYADFGPAGTVVSDSQEPLLGIRLIRFANGVRLNLKRTSLEKDKVLVQLALDGGDRIAGRDNPLAVEMTPFLAAGGLGKHSLDDLQTLNAGRSVTLALGAGPDAFAASAMTTTTDLERQLQLLTALIVDPGYRREGEIQYRLGVNNFFAQLRSTPQSALSSAIDGIISDYDPRFTLQKVESYRALTFDKLKRDLSERLAHGAIEVALVGDIDEAQAIALVARTLGALPVREPEFRAYPEERKRGFAKDRSVRSLYHTGAPDQALVRFIWPTRDDSDPVAKQQFNLLQRVVQIELTETLREKLGKAYSPSATSDLSRAWDGYGTFAVTAMVAADELDVTTQAIRETIATLRDAPVDPDILERARQPLVETVENALKTNAGWMSIVGRAQREPDRAARQVHALERLRAVTAEQLRALARLYLTDAPLVVLVKPETKPSEGRAPR